jgi:hypothetical protein
MPVILASQEAEIGGLRYEASPGQIVHETLAWKIPSQKSASGLAQSVGSKFKPQYKKKKKKKRGKPQCPRRGKVMGEGNKRLDCCEDENKS